MINLYNSDCMEALKGMEDNQYDLAIVDPPYGIGETAIRSKQRVPKKHNNKWLNRRAPNYKGNNTWDDSPPNYEYFTELDRVSKNRIIWGANHFGMMPPSSGWVVWYKKRLNEINDFSDAELAFTSFSKGCRLFHFPWIGFGAVNAKEKRSHPTQKPVALYKWLLKNYAKEGDKILDTHGGSMSIALACHDMKFDLDLYEIDKDYFQAGKKRYNNHIRQLQLF